MSAAGATKQGFFRWANAAYQRSMARRPMTTLCAVNGCLACIADCMAQKLPALLGEEKVHRKAERELKHAASHKALERQFGPGHPRVPAASPAADVATSAGGYDVVRTARLGAYGVAVAPIVQTWFLFLDRTYPLPSAASAGVAARAVVKRVLADQAVFAPLGLALFFSVMAVLEGKDVKQRFQDAYVPALTANWKVWPIAQFINFRFCPVAYRVPFTGALSIFWTAYLSWLNSAAKTEEADLKERGIR